MYTKFSIVGISIQHKRSLGSAKQKNLSGFPKPDRSQIRNSYAFFAARAAAALRMTRPLQIQCQQPRHAERFIIAEVDRPTIGSEDRRIEFLVRIIRPRRPFVV